MSKEKILLIAGCSNAAGMEIDGSFDSVYNRQHSFGNLLASKMGRIPINAAMGSVSNPAIARTVLDWFTTQYNPETMEVFVLIAWTETIRIDYPSPFIVDYSTENTSADFYTKVTEQFMQINAGWPGIQEQEKEIIAYWQRFQAQQEVVCQTITVNMILQMQYFLKMMGCEYLMCNTLSVFNQKYEQLKFYYDLIDQSRYIDAFDDSKNFYWFYRALGYTNPKAQYWHHGQVPHELYATQLFNFIKTSSSYSLQNLLT
jgi:hypothetical protein